MGQSISMTVQNMQDNGTTINSMEQVYLQIKTENKIKAHGKTGKKSQKKSDLDYKRNFMQCRFKFKDKIMCIFLVELN